MTQFCLHYRWRRLRMTSDISTCLKEESKAPAWALMNSWTFGSANTSMRNFEPFWDRACASCRRTVQRAACVPASALSTATRFVEYRLTDGHSVGAAPGNHWGSISSCSYIKPQLASRGRRPRGGCLSSCSYIKPQLARIHALISYVVYHLVPTSNHNAHPLWVSGYRLFIILFLHQTTTKNNHTLSCVRCLSSCSYIKPQRSMLLTCKSACCLSSCSYIKPQLKKSSGSWCISCLSSCSYIKPQPKNVPWFASYVVYHLVPTSNHN